MGRDAVIDTGFAYWHSATFNNDGTKVIFTDEWGGGSRPRCRASDPLNYGADAIYDIVDGKLVFRSYFKIPSPQTVTENCVAHNGSVLPIPGRDVFIQAWYQGGLSVIDFTDSANPFEIAFFDRGPISTEELITGGFWSAYYYDGRIYGSEITRGLDVLALEPSEFPWWLIISCRNWRSKSDPSALASAAISAAEAMPAISCEVCMAECACGSGTRSPRAASHCCMKPISSRCEASIRPAASISAGELVRSPTSAAISSA
ncbi:hypothetical protein SNE32_00600 [Lysobacter sp. D1-1-M9]